MDRPFLTIEQQVERLERRGMRTSGETAGILMREGYYSVVNGYKAPFIDAEASKEAGDDRYIDGATFDQLYALFLFDRDLRELTFHYLIRAEATTRTAISYCFSEAHRSPDAYLLQANYCSYAEYAAREEDPSDYADELAGLTGILRSRANSSRTEFVTHYREEHGGVPLWVLSNDLTFGNLEHFFNLMKPVEQKSFCKMVATSTGRLADKTLGYFGPDKARVCLEALVKFRNICAHDERIYCARVGGRKNIGYSDMLWMLERFLTRDEFNELLGRLVPLLKEAGDEMALMHVFNEAGMSKLADELGRRSAIMAEAIAGSERDN